MALRLGRSRYSKWLTDWRDTQLEGPIDNTENPFIFGDLPNTAPTYSGAGGPMWGGIVVLLPYELYLLCPICLTTSASEMGLFGG